MDKSEEYQGHTNWATWNMSLWLNNEAGAYRHMFSCYDAASAKSKALGCFPDGTPDMEPGDLEDVDWYSVAEAFAYNGDN
jgi:hypothetical protein